MGKIHTGLFQYRTIGKHPAATTATFLTLPFLNDEVGAAIFRCERRADAFLQRQKVGFYGR